MFNSRGLDSMLLDIPRIRASATCIGHLSPMKSLTSFTRPPSPSCKPPVPRDDEPRMNMDEICITPLFFIHLWLRRPKVSLPYIYIYPLPDRGNNFVFIARGRRSARKGSLPAMTPAGFITEAGRNHSSTTLTRCTKRSRRVPVN